MSKLILKPKEDVRVRAGHLWIFSNEVAEVSDLEDNGGLVDVVGAGGRFIGRAYYNRHSLIAARLLTRRQEEIGAPFFVRRLEQAKAWREQVMGTARSCRLVYSEADLLPGVIVDRYEDSLVVQLLTLGMEQLRAPFMEALEKVFAPAGILLRNDSSFRELEGLPKVTDVVYGQIPERVIIEEAGARFAVDLLKGQKTGFYFDQRDARAVVRKLAGGRRVLDCFCYTGGFGINGAVGGAVEVLAVDESAAALEMLRENAGLNGVDKTVTIREANCFELLREMHRGQEHFDLIILDPPAFVKSKRHLKSGLAGYREINLTAMKLLSPDGILVTCSCSQNLSLENFQSMLQQAAKVAGRHFRVRYTLTQAADHPVLQAMPETKYLKSVVLQAM